MKDRYLAGRTAWVTGGASGMGRATALRLAETRAAIAAHGVEALALPLDVCSDSSVDSFHQRVVAAFGKVDILVNAAGSSARKLISDHPDALWPRMIDVNLNGPYRTIKRCFP